MPKKKSGPVIGSISWTDLTIPNATKVSDFYTKITGWKPQAVDMGGYEDLGMVAADGKTVAGICHARGCNADVPPQWLIYIVVEDADKAAKDAVKLGGKVLAGPRALGDGRFCVVKDPAGAVAAFYSQD